MREELATQNQTFLIRCQQESMQGEPSQKTLPWRFTIEQVHGEANRRGFIDIDGLLDHFRDELLTLVEHQSLP